MSFWGWWSSEPVVEPEVEKKEEAKKEDRPSFREPSTEDIEGERDFLPQVKHDNIATIYACESGMRKTSNEMIESLVNILNNKFDPTTHSLKFPGQFTELSSAHFQIYTAHSIQTIKLLRDGAETTVEEEGSTFNKDLAVFKEVPRLVSCEEVMGDRWISSVHYLEHLNQTLQIGIAPNNAEYV